MIRNRGLPRSAGLCLGNPNHIEERRWPMVVITRTVDLDALAGVYRKVRLR